MWQNVECFCSSLPENLEREQKKTKKVNVRRENSNRAPQKQNVNDNRNEKQMGKEKEITAKNRKLQVQK